MIDDNIKGRIEQLDKNDAQAMIKIIYGFVETAMTGNVGDKMKLDCLDRISNFHNSISDLKESTN
ncbi:hypothetical protein [Bacillus suaedae]|uniref:Uncharacterized protein n=1 Tax=Halalkalibacter suaedae TaxID=2822140 RepID=A0A940WWT1_9BACI|nr:hypothetical protein [Bacillus suaedae]MBP3953123.1 hypothetical protein [Bacillus suaedae]